MSDIEVLAWMLLANAIGFAFGYCAGKKWCL